MKKYFFLFLFTLIGLTFSSCNQGVKSDKDKLHENCYLKPDPGPCRMAINRYYYDEKEKKCKLFIYGGCKGAVPFKSLKACQVGCGCDLENN